MTAGAQAGPTLSPSTRVHTTPFAAYTVYNHTLLPTVFRSLDEDYRHLRAHVQLWDVSCERQVEVRGPDAARLVQLLTPRDLSAAQPGRCLYAPLVDAAGGMVNDPVISVLDDDHFWLSIADADVDLWISGLAHGLGLDVAVSTPPVAPLAIQGPKADDLVARVFGDAVRDIRFFRFAHLRFADHTLMVARTGWSRQGGFEIYVDRGDLALPLWDALWDAGQDLGVAAGGPNLIERIEGGLLSYGADMTRGHNPFECRFERYCHLDRPITFVGRAALEQVASRGVTRRIMGLEINAATLPPCVVPWPVTAGGQRVGEVTSAAVSPTRERGVAIATLDRTHAEPATELTVVTPAGITAATVSELPFASPSADVTAP
jgi:dimethylsulfoniopropionate demethylase